jgi:hypothetical protein
LPRDQRNLKHGVLSWKTRDKGQGKKWKKHAKTKHQTAQRS